MELNHFLERIRMMPEASRAVMELQIPEEEYQKNRALFWRDKDGFYKEVLKEKDFRIRFLYYFSRMACEVYEEYRQRKIEEDVYWDIFYDLTLWCENADYPKTTSLQRKAKEYMLEGKRLGSGIGILRVEMFE